MRNRHFQVRLVKDQPSEQTPIPAVPQNSPETIVIEAVRETAPYVAGLFVAYKFADVLSKTAMHIVTTKIK